MLYSFVLSSFFFRSELRRKTQLDGHFKGLLTSISLVNKGFDMIKVEIWWGYQNSRTRRQGHRGGVTSHISVIRNKIGQSQKPDSLESSFASTSWTSAITNLKTRLLLSLHWPDYQTSSNAPKPYRLQNLDHWSMRWSISSSGLTFEARVHDVNIQKPPDRQRLTAEEFMAQRHVTPLTVAAFAKFWNCMVARRRPTPTWYWRR
jgi:hypothetical protein